MTEVMLDTNSYQTHFLKHLNSVGVMNKSIVIPYESIVETPFKDGLTTIQLFNKHTITPWHGSLNGDPAQKLVLQPGATNVQIRTYLAIQLKRFEDFGKIDIKASSDSRLISFAKHCKSRFDKEEIKHCRSCIELFIDRLSLDSLAKVSLHLRPALLALAWLQAWKLIDTAGTGMSSVQAARADNIDRLILVNFVGLDAEDTGASSVGGFQGPLAVKYLVTNEPKMIQRANNLAKLGLLSNKRVLSQKDFISLGVHL